MRVVEAETFAYAAARSGATFAIENVNFIVDGQMGGEIAKLMRVKSLRSRDGGFEIRFRPEEPIYEEPIYYRSRTEDAPISRICSLGRISAGREHASRVLLAVEFQLL